MSVISALMVRIGADSSGIRKELKNTKKEIGNAFSLGPILNFNNALTGTTANVGMLINKFNSATLALGTGFGLTSIISGAVAAGAAVKDLSDKLQISTAEAENFSRIIKLTGSDADTAAAAMMRLDSAISGNGESAQKTRAVLDAVGVSLTDQNGKLLPINEQLKNLALGYQAATQAGYGQEFIMNTLGVRGMALTQTLMKYNEAAEDAGKIKSIGLDVNQMAELDRQLTVTQAQLEQLKLAGGAAFAPLVQDILPLLTEGLSATASLISENKDLIEFFSTGLIAAGAAVKTAQIAQTIKSWTEATQTAIAATNTLDKMQEASISRRLNTIRATQKKEEQLMIKEVNARKITEAEKEKIITDSCVKIQMKYAETSARIEAEMRSAYQKVNAQAKISAAGQVQAIATTGVAAQAAGGKMVTASAAASGAVTSLTKNIWNLVGGWYAVAAAIGFAFEKLVEFKQEKSKEIIGDIYVGNQQYRRGADGAFYRQDINMEAEDAFDTYTETHVTDEEELAAVRAAYLAKHPVQKTETPKTPDVEKYKNVFGAVGGGDGGSGGKSKGSAGKETDPEKEEQERRQKLQRSVEQEYSARKSVNDAMRESTGLQTAYMTAAEKAVFEIEKDHERAVETIRNRWLEFETSYIGMSDTERERLVKNLEEQGVAYEIAEDGKLSLAKQVAIDIAASNKQYDDEIVSYHAQCKDILAEIDEAFRENSMEKLQEALSEENTAMLNAYNTRQGLMKRYYDNWLLTHRTTSEMVADIVMDSQSSFENFFKNVLTGQKSFGDSFMDLLNGLLDSIVKSIAETMAAQVVNQFLNWIMPGFFSGGGSVASGGFNSHGAAANVLGIRLGNFAMGGVISGPGTATSDSIPAMLSDGEYVIKADAVRRVGLPMLDAINSGAVRRFAQGGYVSRGSGTNNPVNDMPNVIVNITNESGVPVTAEETGSSFDGENYIVTVMLNAIATNKMGIRSTMKGAMS